MSVARSSSHMQRLRYACTAMVISFVVLSTLLASVPPRSSDSKRQMPSATEMDSVSPRAMNFPYYSLKDGFESTAFLINNSLGPTELTVTLHGRRGKTATSKMNAPPRQKLSISIRHLLRELDEDSDGGGDFAEGNIAVTYVGMMMQVVGQVSIVNERLSLVHESEMVENDPGMSDIPPVLNGLWWGLQDGRDAQVMVSNTADEPVVADVWVSFNGGRHTSSPLFFAEHETKVLSVTELLGDLKTTAAEAPAGGITIIPRPGLSHSLIAEGAVLDRLTGFSTTLHFPLPQLQKASSLHAVGVPIGTPAPGSPFANAGFFVPHVVVRNLGNSPQTINVSVEFPATEGVAEFNLPSFKLSANATQDISLRTMLPSLPLALPFCSIRIQYSEAPGSVIAEVASVEQEENLVVDNRVANDGDEFAGSGANPWHVDKETQSILFLTNMGDEPARIGLNIVANGVSYHVTHLTLNPHETRGIDIGQLRDAGKPDFQGNVLPKGATDGIVDWQRIDHVAVAGRLVVIDRSSGLASNFDCTQCQCPARFESFVRVDPNSATTPVGGTSNFAAMGRFTSCTQSNYFTGISAAWTSSNSAAATLGSGGTGTTATGKGAGSATITATAHACGNWSFNTFCTCTFLAGGSGSATLTVTPRLGSISPAKGPIGATTSVTLSGQGFGASPSVNAGPNITVTVTSKTDTQIQANFAVSSSATGGNQAVTVTTSGQTSNSVNFFVQIPTSLSIVAGTDSTTSEALCTFTSGGTTFTGCGVTRSFNYQVNDQESPPQPIQTAGLQVWDAINTTSPNNLNIGGFNTTCSAAGKPNSGPCNVTTNASGQFGENNPGLSVCSTVCRVNNACVKAGPTNANQTYHVGPSSIVQQIAYNCDHITVNGQ